MSKQRRMRRHDVASTLIRRCFKVVYLMVMQLVPKSHVLTNMVITKIDLHMRFVAYRICVNAIFERSFVNIKRGLNFDLRIFLCPYNVLRQN